MNVSLEDYENAMERGLETLRKGGVLVFPTDTVYGIGCDATNNTAIERIYELKARDARKPLAVIMGGLEMARQWCDIPRVDEWLMTGHLPGPYTFILKLKETLELAGQKKTIGVRVPAHAFVRKLAENFGKPIAATSANLSGEKDAWDFGEVDKGVRDASDLCIDGGQTAHKAPSTVVDLVERKILRQGAGEFSFK